MRVPLLSGVLIRVPFYIMSTQQVFIRVPPYINVPIRVPLISDVPIKLPPTSDVPIRVPPLHQLSPSEYPFTSAFPTSAVPIRVPPYISVPIRIPLYIQVWSVITIRVPPYIKCENQSAPLHQASPSHCHFTWIGPISVPSYINCLHQIGWWVSGCILRDLGGGLDPPRSSPAVLPAHTSSCAFSTACWCEQVLNQYQTLIRYMSKLCLQVQTRVDFCYLLRGIIVVLTKKNDLVDFHCRH